ncbi:MAG: hypothetical protein JW772_03380 [Candidatus Diapherotrites archaeon]|nr:hypothetical protein [Candidatus Diapherotrites archaeon]
MPKPKLSVLKFEGAQELLSTIAGDYAVEITKIWERKGKMITDEEIAKKMKLKVTEARTILNRLHYRGISCYHKTKNTKTGWYSYTWEIKTKRVLELLLEKYSERLEKLEVKRNFEQNYAMFTCKKQCDYIPFEIAVEYLFKCPECGATLEAVDNKKRIKNIEKEMELLKGQSETIKKTQ